jgi:hypothetical protein
MQKIVIKARGTVVLGTLPLVAKNIRTQREVPLSIQDICR